LCLRHPDSGAIEAIRCYTGKMPVLLDRSYRGYPIFQPPGPRTARLAERESIILSIGRDAAAFGPGAEEFDALAEDDREGLAHADGREDVVGGALAVVGEGGVHA
jgi:hypothetical protein